MDECCRAMCLWSLTFLSSFSQSDFPSNKLFGRPPQYAPAPCKLTFDLLNLKVVSESRVTRATSVPILVFLGLSVLDLGPTYATDRRQT